MNSPRGNGFWPALSKGGGRYASTMATVMVRPRGALVPGTSSPSPSESSSASVSISASNVSSIVSAVAALSSPSSRRAAGDIDHEPSGISPTVGDGGGGGGGGDGGGAYPATSPISMLTYTGISPSSSASLTAARATSARVSSVCRAMIFSSRRSSLRRPSSLRYLAHASGSTLDVPASICSRSASACSFSRRSSRVCPRRARPPR
mmetsp:Transcript_2049/g.4751  ORF Transcript_2049/g.4751 Transcript_2049/m.4751 type:complete len:206 (-) Transcript_2049:70-687(-)